jgi:hypothetical protein
MHHFITFLVLVFTIVSGGMFYSFTKSKNNVENWFDSYVAGVRFIWLLMFAVGLATFLWMIKVI